jgi:threonine dehydrogenase-like Zn-dependent dehydrogenase
MTQIESKIIELLGPRQIHIKSELLDTGHLGENQVAAKSICSVVSPGTEVAAYRGDPPLRPMKVYPRVVGYCNVAEIIACGRGVQDFQSGDRILTNQSHRSSFVCSESSILAKVPETADPQEAATTYLFQLGYNALLKAEFKPGHGLAIIGLGTLGLATAAVAGCLGEQARGFTNQVFDSDTLRAFHLSKVFAKSMVVGNKTAGDGFGLVVSTSNGWDDWHLALSLTRKEGIICVLGFPGRVGDLPNFNPLSSEFFYDRQLKIISCGMTPGVGMDSARAESTLQKNCKFLLDLIIERRLAAKELISATAAWYDIGKIYERIASREAGFWSAALIWN